MTILDVFKFITKHPLNEGRQLKAINKFLKWQIGSRLIDSEVIYHWVGNSKFYVRTGETALTVNIYTGLYEFEDMGYLLHALRPDDLFIDVGANAGSYTILASAVIGSKTIAFEPIPKTYTKLIDNIRLNSLENLVTSFNLGVGCEKGVINFTNSYGAMNHVVENKSMNIQEHIVSVEMTTIDINLQHKSPVLMKIDVEGYETQVLQGAMDTLKNPSLHSVIIELNGSGSRYQNDENAILEVMFDFGFKTYSYDPFSRDLKDLNGKSLQESNTLFIRDKGFVLDRLKSAPLIAVNGKEF